MPSSKKRQNENDFTHKFVGQAKIIKFDDIIPDFFDKFGNGGINLMDMYNRIPKYPTTKSKSTYIRCVHSDSFSHPFGNPRAAKSTSG